MRYLVIGTAGHVDHGKTALIKALTGIDTDRLREEKERGISIELGFAYLDLPDGRRAGIIDVPGHEKFVKNMLAGIGGIDLVLLVIAADEGVMPQTREHFDILQLLGIERGIVVLNKIDLVDADWLDLVEDDVYEFLSGTVLEGAPVVKVSAVTGAGTAELLAEIAARTAEIPDRQGRGAVRLPIDRVFSVVGFGTVVTGTLASGILKTGDAVEIMPKKLPARVRSLQTHKQKVPQAGSGQRVAVNLAGLDAHAVDRGDVLTAVGAFRPTRRLDARLYLLEGARKDLKNRARIRLHLGAAEIMSRVLLLDRDELAPGEECYVQLLLEAESIADRGDRFVIRSYSPMRTIGGGWVIDPTPPRHKRFQAETLKRLTTMEKGTPGEVVELVLRAAVEPLTAGDLVTGTGLDAATVTAACAELAAAGVLRQLRGGEYLVHADNYTKWKASIQKSLADYHRRYPLREGFPKEELRSRVFPGFSTGKFHDLLQVLSVEGWLTLNPQSLALTEFSTADPPEKMQRRLEKLERIYREAHMQPPTVAQALEQAGLGEAEGQECLHCLLRRGTLVRVDEEFCFQAATVEEARRRIREFLVERGELSIGEVRDLLKSSRKYALPLLEYFDRIRFTKRVGDMRVLAKK
ncbi:MAG: selenocysteine-specific translation elongation factor [Candidatus Desulforudis sp.]|nr:selenocysteine-specific translation elongation factor [Desulforudis sp.]